MALELAEADDGIGVVQIGRVGNVLCHARVRQVGLPLGKVPVERAARLLDGRKAAGTVDGVQMPRCVGAAGAVAHDDGRAAPDERLRQDPQQHRMGRCGPLRLHGRDEVRLDGDAHAGFTHARPPNGASTCCRAVRQVSRLIIGARGNGRIGHAAHTARSSSSRRAARQAASRFSPRVPPHSSRTHRVPAASAHATKISPTRGFFSSAPGPAFPVTDRA